MINSVSIRNVALETNIIAEGVISLKRSINTISCTLQSLRLRFPHAYPPVEQNVAISSDCQSSTNPEPDGKNFKYLHQSREAQPATQLELSSNFFPEQYTSSSRMKQLKVYYMIEKSCSDVERVNEYHLWYSERPRKWRTIIVELTAKQTSNFWPICQSPRSMSALIAAPLLPNAIQTQIEDRVCDLVPCDYVHLSFELDDGSKAQDADTRSEASCLKIGFHRDETRRLLDFVRDLGCPMLCENEVVPQHFLNANMFLSSTPSGRICIEHKIYPASCCTEDFFQQIKLLHCLKWSPHVVDFVGVVVDDSFSSVKSYLTVPTSMTLGRMLSLGFLRSKWGLPLSTRLAWAQQIITGIRDIHQMGFVVGLATNMDVRVDNLGNIKFATFRSSIRPEDCYRSETPGQIAPEQKICDNGEFKCTSRTDLFQLGGVLKLLAHFCGEASGVCFKFNAGCPEGLSESTDSFVDPVTLPMFEEYIPPWYTKMIEICQSPLPEDRLPASALLAMFPQSLTSEPIRVTLPPEIKEAARAKTTGVRRDPHCNRCSRVCTGWHYHCNLCFWGDYDICWSCVASGFHCEDESHFLGIRRWNGYLYENTEQYHSEVIIDEEKKDNILVFK